MIIRTLAVVATLLALVFVQLGAAHQPAALRSEPAARAAAALAPPTGVAEGVQRALEDLAAWPAAFGR